MNKPEKHQQAVEIISECLKETNKTYGYRRVHEYLSTHGIKLNRKTVINKYNLLSEIRSRRKYCVMSQQLQLHSDQGAQYVSHEYYRLTQSYNITPSMSRRGNLCDNALAEYFFSILKTECIYRQKIDTFTQAQELIHNYIWFYNNECIQLKTKLAPLATRHQFLA